MNTILTDDERRAAWDSAPRLHQDDIARAIEAAVLTKLREQEPVAHRYRFGDVWMFDTYRWNGQDADEVVPVYEHPAPLKDEHSPCMGTNCGKTRYDQEHSAECIAETATSQGWDTHPAPLPAVVQVPQGWKLVPVELLKKAAGAINWHLEPNSPDEHEQIWLELRALAAAPEAPAQGDNIDWLLMQEARDALCEWANTGFINAYDVEGLIASMSLSIGLRGQQPAQPSVPDPLEKLTRIQEELSLYDDKPAQPSVPAPWREAVKVMRTTLEDWLGDYGDCAEGGEADELVKFTRAAIALADSLEGGE